VDFLYRVSEAFHDFRESNEFVRHRLPFLTFICYREVEVTVATLAPPHFILEPCRVSGEPNAIYTAIYIDLSCIHTIVVFLYV
jgi:hypothetical protein